MFLYTPTSKELRLLKTHTKELHCKLELLDKNLNVIDSLEGIAIDGSLSIDANSDIRRTFSGTIHLNPRKKISRYETNEQTDKMVRVYIGMSVNKANIYQYPQGVFAFSQNGFTYSSSEHTVSISCVDLVALLDGTLGGTLTGYKTTISIGTNIRSAIENTYKLSGMTDCSIDYQNRKVPNDIDFQTGTTIWSILTQLRDLYYPFEMFFNNTTFVCQEIPSGFDDPVALKNNTFQDLVISEDCTIDYSKVKNCVELFGASIEYDQFVSDDKMETSNEKDTTNITLNTVDLETNNDGLIAFTTPLLGLTKRINITIVNSVTETDDDNNTSVKKYRHGPYTLYESDVDENGTDVAIDGTTIPCDTMVVVKYSPSNKAFYYRGEQQIHVMVKLVDKYPTDDEIESDKKEESCNYIKYICLTNSESKSLTDVDSYFTIDKIGRRNLVCSGSDYEIYNTSASALQCAEYEHWKACRLTDSVSVECLLVPWLDVNQKISYIPKYINSNDEELEFIIKQINISLGSGTMSLTLSRYYPYYPYIVENKY